MRARAPTFVVFWAVVLLAQLFPLACGQGSGRDVGLGQPRGLTHTAHEDRVLSEHSLSELRLQREQEGTTKPRSGGRLLRTGPRPPSDKRGLNLTQSQANIGTAEDAAAASNELEREPTRAKIGKSRAGKHFVWVRNSHEQIHRSTSGQRKKGSALPPPKRSRNTIRRSGAGRARGSATHIPHDPLTEKLPVEWWERQSEAAAGEGEEPQPRTVPCCCAGLSFRPYLGCLRQCSGPYVPALRYVGPVGGQRRDELPADRRSLNLRAALYEQIQGREVVLIGDSLTRQWFESLMCWLGEPWEGWAIDEDGKLPPVLKAYLNGVMGEVDDRSAEHGKYACQAVGSGTLMVYNTNGLSFDQRAKVIAHHSRTAAAVVVGAGAVHYNDFDGSGKAVHQLQSKLDSLMGTCSATGAACVLKDATPQHFRSGNFLYSTAEKARRQEYIHYYNAARVRMMEQGLEPEQRPLRERFCRGFVGWEAESTAWRHLAVVNASQAWGVPMLEIYKKLATRGDAHFGVDCTHFVFDAEVWEPLHLELLAHLERLPRPAANGGTKDTTPPPRCPNIH